MRLRMLDPRRMRAGALSALLASCATPPSLAQKPAVPDQKAPSGSQPGGADDEAMGRALQITLRNHGSDVYGCYDKAQTAEGRELAGELLMRLSVAPGGAVTRSEILKDQVGSKTLADCLTAAMARWKVPEIAGADPRQVVFPLVFKPDADAAHDGRRAHAGGAPYAGRPRYVVPLSEGKPGPLGQRGKVEARVLIDPVTVGETTTSLTQLVLHATARLAPHSHPGVLEALYVVKGMARVRTAHKGAILIANSGDLIVVPPSGLHSIESAPLASLTLIQIFAPSGPEHAYRDASDRSGTVPARARTTERTTDPPVVVKAGEPRSWPILGGKGQVQLMLDNLPVGEASVQRFEADAGSDVAPHAHDRSDEVMFVFSGKGQLNVGGAIMTVGANDAVHVPMGVPHSLHVTERLVALQCYSPAGPEQRFKKPPASKPTPSSEKHK